MTFHRTAVDIILLVLLPLTLYIFCFSTTSPGGGFQAGVMLASIVFLRNINHDNAKNVKTPTWPIFACALPYILYEMFPDINPLLDVHFLEYVICCGIFFGTLNILSTFHNLRV